MLRARLQPVADLSGSDVLVSTTINGKTRLRFRWTFPGVAMDAFRPQILIEGTAPAEGREALEAVWEMALSSFRHVR